MHTDDVPADLIKLLAEETDGLEAAVSRLQQVQNRLPLPSLEELVAMRRGRRPVSPPVVLAGVLQRGIVRTETFASELRCEIEDPRQDLMWDQLTVIEINHIESALESMTAAREVGDEEGDRMH